MLTGPRSGLWVTRFPGDRAGAELLQHDPSGAAANADSSDLAGGRLIRGVGVLLRYRFGGCRSFGNGRFAFFEHDFVALHLELVLAGLQILAASGNGAGNGKASAESAEGQGAKTDRNG